MKQQLVKLMDKILLRKRSLIETVNDQLKNISQIEHSRHRSVWNFMVNLFSSLIAYTYLPKKPSRLFEAQRIACFAFSYPLILSNSRLEKLAIAFVEDIAKILQPLGLFFRAERLSQTAQIIQDKHKGEIPWEEKELLKLPGIGKYTARAICSQAFDRSAAVMDTNVARILERFFGIKGGRVKSRCKILWSAADKIAADTDVGYWNLTLLDFGAKVCTARKPKCLKCPVAT